MMTPPPKLTGPLFPSLLDKTPEGESSLKFSLHIREDLAFFEGHFPIYSIVPGVTLVDWVVRFAGIKLPDMEKIDIKKLKFQRPVGPGHTIILIITFDAERPMLRFSYQGASGEYSSGEIHWDGPHAKPLCRDSCL